MQDGVRRLGTRARARWRGTGDAVITIARLTVATVVAYLFTLALTRGPVDLTGALTALLVTQASTYSTVRMGLVRVGAVLTGVAVAVGVSMLVGLTWWSLGLAVAAALVLAHLLRLDAQRLETPISAMLILGVTHLQIAVETRVFTTFIGAATGVGLMFLWPRQVPARPAADAVRSVAAEAADNLRAASVAMAAQPVHSGAVTEWLVRARATSARFAAAERLVDQVGESRKLNPVALATTSSEPFLRSGLDALGAALFAVQALFARMLGEAPKVPTADDGYGDQVRASFSHVLDAMAACFDAYGAMVQAEVNGGLDDAQWFLGEHLARLRHTNRELTELLFVDPRSETSLWLLRGAILSSVAHVLIQLDIDQRAATRARLQAIVEGEAVWLSWAPRQRNPQGVGRPV